METLVSYFARVGGKNQRNLVLFFKSHDKKALLECCEFIARKCSDEGVILFGVKNAYRDKRWGHLWVYSFIVSDKSIGKLNLDKRLVGELDGVSSGVDGETFGSYGCPICMEKGCRQLVRALDIIWKGGCPGIYLVKNGIDWKIQKPLEKMAIEMKGLVDINAVLTRHDDGKDGVAGNTLVDNASFNNPSQQNNE